MIRKAKISDVDGIRQMIGLYAKNGVMLPRPKYEIYECIRDFYVHCGGDNVLGCCAVPIYGKEYPLKNGNDSVLAEIRSLAVHPDYTTQGIGKGLVAHAIEDVIQIGVTKIFTLTYVPVFFRKLGFEEASIQDLPQKIWSDCTKCAKFPEECDETAMIMDLRAIMPPAQP